MTQKELMQKAIELSIDNVNNNGGPFGAVIADKAGNILATGVNRVTSNNDPTAHAEVNAIRQAAATLGTVDLSGYDIYTSCEPCPMCLGAIYWAHLDKIFYANTKDDAKDLRRISSSTHQTPTSIRAANAPRSSASVPYLERKRG